MIFGGKNVTSAAIEYTSALGTDTWAQSLTDSSWGSHLQFGSYVKLPSGVVYYFGGFNGSYLSTIHVYDMLNDNAYISLVALPFAQAKLACTLNEIEYRIYWYVATIFFGFFMNLC